MRALHHLDKSTISAPIPGLFSLRQMHVDDVQAALASFAPGWSLEQHDDYDGDLMLIISAPEDQITSACYLLYANREGFHLTSCRDDTVIPIDSFLSLSLAVDKLQTVITSLSSNR